MLPEALFASHTSLLLHDRGIMGSRGAQAVVSAVLRLSGSGSGTAQGSEKSDFG